MKYKENRRRTGGLLLLATALLLLCSACGSTETASTGGNQAEMNSYTITRIQGAVFPA